MTGSQNRTYARTGNWARRGACVGALETMSMPIDRRGAGYGGAGRARIANAKAVCRHCPVLAECRAWALTDPDPVEYMVAGGMTPKERQLERGPRQPLRYPVPPSKPVAAQWPGYIEVRGTPPGQAIDL